LLIVPRRSVRAEVSLSVLSCEQCGANVGPEDEYDHDRRDKSDKRSHRSKDDRSDEDRDDRHRRRRHEDDSDYDERERERGHDRTKRLEIEDAR
jgi:hypothetical protein